MKGRGEMRGLQREPWGMEGGDSLGSRVGAPLERLEETAGKGRVKARKKVLRVRQWRTPALRWVGQEMEAVAGRGWRTSLGWLSWKV